MNSNESQPSKTLEKVVGIATSLAALLFWFLVVFFLIKGRYDFARLMICLLLIIFALGFSKLSYRLLMDKPNKSGGLLSNFSLKLLCISLGVLSIIMAATSLYEGVVFPALSGAFLLIVSLYGWDIAAKRAETDKKT
ncbi:MAG: hypothetical protein COA71_01795 [SAR86 cluster bacterium]|uniref:Uncharacterized protein n=1 Tax=SAR86 cluster bacterium TaxID=2030880 RepID=A0A2A5CJN3_9GAMM|nr:MAG: hypothetical protein COA71_01795 [SAR86 cluster bacterium]